MTVEPGQDVLAHSEPIPSARTCRLDWVAEGFSFPTSLTFDEAGVAYVAESGLPFGGDVVVDETFEPEERWNFALAVREGDDSLREALDTAIRQMIGEGSVARIFAAHRVPYLEPI